MLCRADVKCAETSLVQRSDEIRPLINRLVGSTDRHMPRYGTWTDVSMAMRLVYESRFVVWYSSK